MIVTPKLPIWLRSTLWKFGAIGFAALLLATLSMFVSICIVTSPVHLERRRYMEHMHSSEYSFSAVSLSEGALSIGKHFDYAPLKLFKTRTKVPAFHEQIQYPIHYENLGKDGVLHFSLVSIGIISLLAFLLLARKARHMRRAALLVR